MQPGAPNRKAASDEFHKLLWQWRLRNGKAYERYNLAMLKDFLQENGVQL